MRQISLVCIFMGLSGYAQTAVPLDLGDARVTVTPTNITENRVIAGGSLSLRLTVSTAGTAAPAAVRRVMPTRAIDNKDRNLLGGGLFSAGATRPMYATDLTYGRGGSAHISIGILLDMPARDATSIKLVEGAIEFLVPTESSVVRVTNITSHSGLVENPVLTKHGVVFHFLADQAAFNDAKERYPSLLTRPAPAFPKQAGYFQIDPTGIVAGIQFQDARGTPIPVPGVSWWGNGTSRTGEVDFAGPLPKDAQLVLFLAVPETLKSFPFRIEGIPLP